MPSLTTVFLDKEWAFKHKKTLHTRSSSSSSPSFLDIGALAEYIPSSCCSILSPPSSHTRQPTNTPLLKQRRILHHKQPSPPRDRIERPVQVIPRQLRNVPHQEPRQQIHSTHHAFPHHTLHIAFNHCLVSSQPSHDPLCHPLGRQQSSTVSARRIEDRRLCGTFSSTLPSSPTWTHDVDKHTEGLENHSQRYGTPPSKHPHSPKA